MATQLSASVYVTNATDGNAVITLYHRDYTGAIQSTRLEAPTAGQTVGPLVVNFTTGAKSDHRPDAWAIRLAVKDGSHPGLYWSTDSNGKVGGWKELQLKQSDAGQHLHFKVDSETFAITAASKTTTPMAFAAPYAPIHNVFVLMLENRSFDHIFGFSGIPGINGATTSDTNVYNGQNYAAQSPAPTSMPTDPGHEFTDTVEQLCGPGAQYKAGKYPSIDNSGFAANYATTKDEDTGLPTKDEIGDVMRCFDTPSQLPVIYQLATEFAICDNWFSSLPGPTWPNRFFVHGASSASLSVSPNTCLMSAWYLDGFSYPQGSLYDALNGNNILWRIYQDKAGHFLGAIPQVGALHGVHLWDIKDVANLAGDVKGPYRYAYTFIEPNYGDVSSHTYSGGSSQHPMDGVHNGEALIKATYEAIRNSPLWDSSLLIITYDEHGGFYDSAKPGSACPPDDGKPPFLDRVAELGCLLNPGGFTFDQYGVRVPAVIVSPLIEKGTVDHTLYDHASVVATVRRLFGISSLTERDKRANDLRSLLTLADPRSDCPTKLQDPVPDKPSGQPAASVDDDDVSLPDAGNEIGFLHVMLKADIEQGDPAEAPAKLARAQAINTRGQFRQYVAQVQAKLDAAQTSPPPAGPVTTPS